MKKLTEDQIKSNSNVPTDEIKQDIVDTQSEVDDYYAEKKILMKNPPENKIRIYFLEARINIRSSFIDRLNQIINYRKNNKG